MAVGDDPLRWSSKVVAGCHRSSQVVKGRQRSSTGRQRSLKVVKGRQMVVGGRQRSSKVVKSRSRVLGGGLLMEMRGFRYAVTDKLLKPFFSEG